MLRLTEIGLFLVPFALYVAWLIAGSRVPRWVVWSSVALTLAMAGGTIWFGLINGVPANSDYEPARLENGTIVPGHAVARPGP